MPGRQRSTVRKVVALEEKAERLGADFYRIVPKLYLQRAEKQLGGLSHINLAWCEAMADIATAYRSIQELRKLLEERANELPDPGPCPYVPPQNAFPAAGMPTPVPAA